jgi:hypothetical protein
MMDYLNKIVMEEDTILEINHQTEFLIPYNNTKKYSAFFYCTINILVILLIIGIIFVVGYFIWK